MVKKYRKCNPRDDIAMTFHLYTWVDVEDVLLHECQEKNWPTWLVWAKAYWDGLTLGIYTDRYTEAVNWLSNVFDTRFDKEKNTIILESLQDNQRELPVLFEETEKGIEHQRFIPTFSRPTVVYPLKEMEHPEPLKEDKPPIIAFHSFKGGVGRTIHAIALALNLTKNNKKVLLIDGDLEAPGLSWLLKTRFPNPDISYIDFISLIHGDSSTTTSDSINLVANKLENTLINDIYILPSFRSSSQFTSIEIRPEHLIKGSKDPFILTAKLTDLGKILGVDAIIVDLRAGLSELSAGLLFDPRVYRVIVTTLSSQSLEGTHILLKLIGCIAPSKGEEEPTPAIILSQVTDPFQKEDILDNYWEKLLAGTELVWKSDGEESEEAVPSGKFDLPLQLVTPYDGNMLVLPDSWDDAIAIINSSKIFERMGSLLDWIPSPISKDYLTIQESEDQNVSKRRDLAKYAAQLVYAEHGDIQEFLTIRPLSRLASDFRTKVPIAVIIGAKGSGKTYTFLQMSYRRTWEKFVEEAKAKDITIKSVICPTFWSKVLSEKAHISVQETRQLASQELGLSMPCDKQIISDHIESGLIGQPQIGFWRERWLDILAWGSGFEVRQEGAGRRFANYLREKNLHVVAIIDGLEDLFPNISSNESQQTALRALLQDVPEWLEQQPNRPIGFIVFIRQDMVLNSVRQNPAQLMARYEPYSLKWNSEEALRLAAWIAMKAINISSLQNGKDVSDLSQPDLIGDLYPLWGKKLGKDSSKEARSADWVITALSDLKGQIQARDLVRFLNKAAHASIEDTRWNDRILVPAAIRKSIRECSIDKIAEIEQENEILKTIFANLKSLDPEERLIPFTQEQVKLSHDELATLEKSGAILRDEEEYYMPEIFRWGLGFNLKAGKRPRVLTLARRAQRWNM
jgi:MinD-like ATPase involved in chromosome partitioning or flagellar assembly